MCRNIRTLFNFEPPATDDEVRAASLQYVRKVSGFNAPSQANAAAFDRAVAEVTDITRRLLDGLVTPAPAKDRAEEAAKAKARAAKRFGAALAVLLLTGPAMAACSTGGDGGGATAPETGAGAGAGAGFDAGAGQAGSGAGVEAGAGQAGAGAGVDAGAGQAGAGVESGTAGAGDAAGAAGAAGTVGDAVAGNVELEADVSAIGTCAGRIMLGVGNTVREVRPESPFLIQAVELRISADIAVASVAAFACGGDYLYALVNVGDPDDPGSWLPSIASIRLQSAGGFGAFKLTGLPTTGSLNAGGDIEFAGGRLWVTTLDPGFFRVFDLQTPDAPREIGSLELPVGYSGSGWKPMLSIGDGYAFVTTGTGVLVIDLFEPNAPALIDTVDAPGDPMGETETTALAYATDVEAEGVGALVAAPDGVWSVVRDDASGDWQSGGVISFGPGERRFIGRHDGHPGIARRTTSDTGEEWATVYEEIDLRLPQAPILAAAAGLQNGYARHLVLISEALFAIRHDGSVERVTREKMLAVDPHVE